MEIPKKTAMKKHVLAIFSRKQENVLKTLQENSSNISYTIDGWSSIGCKSYYGITAHFIDQEWKMQSLVLDFVESRGAHTGRDIAKIFYASVEKYGILHKIQGITVDNASANTNFLEELQKIMLDKGYKFDAKDQHFRCFAHILNLGVQDILKLLKGNVETEKEDDDDDEETDKYDDDDDETIVNSPPIIKLRRLFKKIKYSEQWQNKLKSCCEASNTKYLQVSLDISTRWNSTHDMISLGIKMKQAINALCNNNMQLSCFKISDSEWSMLELVQKYLKCFKYLSNTFSGDSYSTLPLVVIGFNILLDKLESLIMELDVKPNRTKDDETFILAFTAGRDKMLKHYFKTNWVYAAALMLDPRHKLETFSMTTWGEELKENSYRKFEDIYSAKYAPKIPMEEISKETNNSDDDEDLDVGYLFKQTSTVGEGEDFWKHELKKYLESDRATKEEDLLEWWKRNEKTFPHIARMARDILSISATSVPAERLFSKAGLVIRKHRNRLNAESARSLLCLNSWYTCSLKSKLE